MDQPIREWPLVLVVSSVLLMNMHSFLLELCIASMYNATQAHCETLLRLLTRQRLHSIRLVGRLFIPLPSISLIKLLFSSSPLHGHLPSPGVLLLLFLARILNPNRHVSAHWHAFLEPTLGS